MILIDNLIQGTLSAVSGTGVGFTPTPFAIWLNGKWQSSLAIADGLYDPNISGRILLSHESTDNGENFVVTNITEGFVTFSVTIISHLITPTVSGGDLIMRRSGIFVQYKDGTNDWASRSMSSVPGGSFGGGTLFGAVYDETNDEFIIIKTGTGADIFTTTDFVNFTSPPLGNPTSLLSAGNFETLLGVHRIGSNYVAYGIPEGLSPEIRSATSTDLSNWTLQTTNLPRPTDTGPAGIYNENLAFFNNLYIIYFRDRATVSDPFKLEIHTSSDGLTWTQASIPALPGDDEEQVYTVLITNVFIEILTASHTYRSSNGTTWVSELLENNIIGRNATSEHLGKAKGYLGDTNAGPDHISLANVHTLQLGGKILELTQTNATPTLGYPSTAPEGATVGWIQNDFNIDQIVDDGFTIQRPSAFSGSTSAQCLYAKNNADGTRYFEITVLRSAGVLNKVGMRVLGDVFIDDYTNPITNRVSFFLGNDQVDTPNGTDITGITHTHTTGQIIGFLINLATGSCDITVDGVALTTVASLNITRSWVIECDVDDGNFFLNVGQETFTHNTTSATSWMTA